MKKLKMNKDCPYISNFIDLNLVGEEKKQKEILKLFREIKEDNFEKLGDKQFLFLVFTQRINRALFSLQHEFDNDCKKFVNECYRFYTFFSNNYKILSSDTTYVKLRVTDDYEATVCVDLIAEGIDTGILTYVAIHPGKPDYTLKVGTKNYYHEDIELFGLFLALQQNENYQYSQKGEAMIYHLQRKDEKSTFDDLEFNPAESNKNYFVANYECDKENMMIQLRSMIDSYLYSQNKSSNLSKCRSCRFYGLCKHVKDISETLETFTPNHKSQSTIYNPEQAKVVAFNKGVARVLAGAGTGKTTTLIGNVIFNINAGFISQQDVLLTTFTDTGANEIKEKLLKAVDEKDLAIGDFKDIQILSFNSLGYRIIQEHYRDLGFSDIPILIDDNEKCSILQNIIDEYPMINGLNYGNPYLQLFNGKGVIFQVSELFTQRKEGILKNFDSFKDDSKYLEDMYSEYSRYLKINNLVEYSDQIKLCIQLLRNNPSFVREYAKRHIIVDEFQDTSEEQLDLIKLLYNAAPEPKTLIVCGDDSQAIFGFRHVGPDNIINFKTSFPDAVDFNIINNYRSYEEVIQLANGLVNDMKKKVEKNPLISVRGNGGKVTILDKNDDDTINSIGDEISSLIQSGTQPEDIAYIAAKRQELHEMYRLLREKNVPATIVVSEYIKDNSKVIAISNLAMYLLNNNNTVALATWLQETIDKFDYKKDISSILLEQAALIQNEIECLRSDEEKIYWFYDQIRKVKPDMGVETLIEMLTKRSYRQYLDLLLFVADIVRKNSAIMISNKGLKYKAVTLTTVHAAKGLEWENVFFNAANCKGENANEADRLQYVGVTRAIKNLYLIPKTLPKNSQKIG